MQKNIFTLKSIFGKSQKIERRLIMRKLHIISEELHDIEFNNREDLQLIDIFHNQIICDVFYNFVKSYDYHEETKK